MKKYVQMLLAGAMAITVATAAHASGKSDPSFLRSLQLQYSVVYSDMLLHAEWLGSLRATSAAIGNNVAMNTEGSANLVNSQLMIADTWATLTGFVHGVHGDVSLQAVAICNNFTTNNTKARTVSINNDQRCATIDPFAISDVTISDVGGDVTLVTAAIANNAALEVEANRLYVENFQVNAAVSRTNVTADIQNVVGDVSVTSVAIGNNLTIDQLLP